MIELIDISKRVNELMKAKGWSAYELSKKSGISANTVYNWERLGAVPSLSNIIKICEAMDITLEQFFSGCSYQLTDDENEILQEWFLLSEVEKDAILNMIDTFKSLKG